MRNKTRTIVLLAVVLTSMLAVESIANGGHASEDKLLTKAIDEIVDAALDDGFAGGVALLQDGQLVYSRVAGFSDRKGRVAVRPETLFQVASVSKYLTAILVLKVAETKRVELNSSIDPWVLGTSLAGRQITWMDLLLHRSGLGSSYAAEGRRNPEKALAAIAKQTIEKPQEGAIRYSNDGYDLLAILLERVFDRPFEELMREQVLEPAGLEAPRFWGEVALDDPERVGQPLRKLPSKLLKRNYAMLGSSGLLINAVDLVRLEAAVSQGEVLSPASIDILRKAGGNISIGAVLPGSFLLEHDLLGMVVSARGYEDWGDNAILNHYLDRRLILAVVTSKGPAEKEKKKPFRTRLSNEIEFLLN